MSYSGPDPWQVRQIKWQEIHATNPTEGEYKELERSARDHAKKFRPRPGPPCRAVAVNGPKLRQLRKTKGWSQELFAEQCNTGVSSVQRAERGEPIDGRQIRKFATILGVLPTVITQ
jgi:ribosome-binding protein aMBF1 (putative translation factor)